MKVYELKNDSVIESFLLLQIKRGKPTEDFWILLIDITDQTVKSLFPMNLNVLVPPTKF